MFRIGIDFDNTIACYDSAFSEVAHKLGMLPISTLSKVQVKGALQKRSGGDISWQKLQGKVYGKYMALAAVFPGFLDFLQLCKIRGHTVFLVSHKTQFGHFDEEQIPLRVKALEWIEAHGCFDELGLPSENVFFEETQDDKVCRIAKLDCSHFIDDLSEVFENSAFPQATKRILFRGAASSSGESIDFVATSWRQITAELLGPVTSDEILRLTQHRFPALRIRDMHRIAGRANSGIVRLISDNGTEYALKIYPDRGLDSRPRLLTETTASKFLAAFGYPVANLVGDYPDADWAVFEWVHGQSIAGHDSGFLGAAIAFVSKLAADSKLSAAESDFGFASEWCVRGQQIEQQIAGRLQRLSTVKDEALARFLENRFQPILQSALMLAKANGHEFFDFDLDRRYWILSPSDFGSHNAIRECSGRIVFIDFEYFGWDDPVKLVSDFYWHPAMNLDDGLRNVWLSATSKLFGHDPTYTARLENYLPLYGLRWCLIILNEFLREFDKTRLQGSQWQESRLIEIRNVQLNKSIILLNQIEGMVSTHGSALKVT